MSILEANIPFLHRVWVEGAERDSHGNLKGALSDPIPRKAIQIYPATSTISRSDMVNPNVVVRTETDIFIDVDDPSLYGARDEVEVFGVKFKVQGDPGLTGWDAMPISGYSDLVPGQIHVKRVT